MDLDPQSPQYQAYINCKHEIECNIIAVNYMDYGCSKCGLEYRETWVLGDNGRHHINYEILPVKG
jgi:hypothetical protein